MTNKKDDSTHAAEGSAIGFYYQSFYALLTLLEQETDNAAVGIELLDDIQLKADGTTLLFQLKHSILDKPPKVSIKSSLLWKTIKVWIDILPKISIAETKLTLVTVAGVMTGSPLESLRSANSNRTDLVDALTEEAERVLYEREDAKKNKLPLPYSDRAPGCEALLQIPKALRIALFNRVELKSGSLTIENIEDQVSALLILIPKTQRQEISNKLIQWWDLQIIYSLCGKRDRVIDRAELQQAVSELIAQSTNDELAPEFLHSTPPKNYQAHGLISKQILLVNGTELDIRFAVREEWRAREQRSKWTNDRPGMASKIISYDQHLIEEWEYRHERLITSCTTSDEIEKRTKGLNLLHWIHDESHTFVTPIAKEWTASYYVRGSYHVLASNLLVGWHPEFMAFLGDTK